MRSEAIRSVIRAYDDPIVRAYCWGRFWILRQRFLDEIGQSNLVLGRSLLERGRLDEAEECFRAADAAFEQMASIAHRTGAWVALGDLAERRGDATEAARLYRNAAEALRVVRF